MTSEEAERVAGICANADSGCPVCVEDLHDSLMKAFPTVDWEPILTRIWEGFGGISDDFLKEIREVKESS